jgi:hypothetical protein
MNTQEQAYLNGFIKKAASYGVDADTAFAILKMANDGPQLISGGGSLINSSTSKPTPEPTSLTGLKGSGTGMMAPGNGFERGFKNMMESFRPAPKPISGGSSFASAPAQQSAAPAGPSSKPGTGGLIDTSGKLTLTPNSPISTTTPLIQGGASTFASNQGTLPQASTPKPSQSAAGMNEGLASHMHLNELPAQPAAPAQQPQQPAAQPSAGPSDAFLRKIMGSYDPNSKVDRAQADRVRQLYAQGKTTAKDIYGSPEYQINREALGARKGANRSAYSGLKPAPGIPR